MKDTKQIVAVKRELKRRTKIRKYDRDTKYFYTYYQLTFNDINFNDIKFSKNIKNNKSQHIKFHSSQLHNKSPIEMCISDIIFLLQDITF